VTSVQGLRLEKCW